MVEDHEARILKKADVYRAFAIMRLIVPQLEIEKWQVLTATAALRHSWLAVCDAKGYIRGLCHVEVRDHPADGRRLEVPVFGIVSLIERENVAEKLFGAIRDRAVDMGCEKVHFCNESGGDWEILRALEHVERRPDGVVYSLPSNPRKLH